MGLGKGCVTVIKVLVAYFRHVRMTAGCGMFPARVLIAACALVLGLNSFPGAVRAAAGWQSVAVSSSVLSGVAYGGGLYVAVGLSGAIFTSPDGIQWTQRQSNTTEWLQGVAYGNGRFVAVGSGGTIVTSEDGLTWTSRAGGAGVFLEGVTYGGGRFVAVGVSGGSGKILTSEDGLTWSAATAPGGVQELRGVAYGNGAYVAVGGLAGEGGGGALVTSPDTVTWAVYDPGVGFLRAVTYGGGLFVAVGNGGAALTSVDGQGWTLRTAGVDTLQSVAYGGGRYVAVGDALNRQTWMSQDEICTSVDAATWSCESQGTTDTFTGVAYGGRFVVVGTGGTVLASTRAPLAAADTYDAGAGTLSVGAPGVLGNDSDPDGDPLTASLVSGAPHGTVSLDVYGSFNYTPAPGFSGTDVFTYKVSDAWLESDPATVTIQVDSLPPVWGSGSSLTATTVGQTEVTLAWTPAADDVGVVAYAVYRDGSRIATVSGSVYGFTVTGLTPGTAYTFKVEAGDAVGNWTADGPSTTVTTAAASTGGGGGGGLCPWRPRVTCAIIDPSQGAVVRESGGAFMLEIPAGAVDAPPGRTVRVLVTSLTAEEAAGLWPATAPLSVRPAGRAFEVRAEILATGREIEGLNPTHPAVFRVSVSPGDTARGSEPEKLGFFQLRADGSLSFAGGRLVDGRLVAELKRFGRYALGAVAVTFSDLAGHWARDEVELMASKFVVQGFPEGGFGPDAGVTRAQFASMLARAMGLTAGQGPGTFADVRPGDWFHPEVTAALRAGIVKGFGDGTFRPNDPVTREQAAAMLVRALSTRGKAGAVLTPDEARRLLAAFVDARAVSAWAVEELALAVREGIVRGQATDDGGTGAAVVPQAGATRAEAAVMIARFWRAF